MTTETSIYHSELAPEFQEAIASSEKTQEFRIQCVMDPEFVMSMDLAKLREDFRPTRYPGEEGEITLYCLSKYGFRNAILAIAYSTVAEGWELLVLPIMESDPIFVADKKDLAALENIVHKRAVVHLDAGSIMEGITE